MPSHQETGPVTRATSIAGWARSSAPTLGYTLGAALAGVVSGVVLARTLGPSIRGEFASIVAWAGVLAIAGDLGIGYAASYLVARRPELASSLWTQCLVFGIGLGTVAAIAAALILPPYLNASHVGTFLTWLGFLAIPWLMAATHQGYLLLGAGHLREANRLRFASPALYGLGIAAAALTGHRSVAAYVTVYVAAQLITFMLAAAMCRRQLRVRLELGMPGVRDVVGFGARTQLGTMAAQATLRMDQLLMSVMLPKTQLGLYVVAVALTTALAPLFTASTLIVSRAILSAGSKREAGRRLFDHLKWMVLSSTVVVVAGIVVCPWLIPLVFGPSFADAVPCSQILLAAAVFKGLNIVLGAALRNLGEPAANTLAEIVGCVVTGVMLFVLLPRLGIVGAAIASLLAYAAAAVVSVRLTLAAVRAPERSGAAIAVGDAAR